MCSCVWRSGKKGERTRLFSCRLVGFFRSVGVMFCCVVRSGQIDATQSVHSFIHSRLLCPPRLLLLLYVACTHYYTTTTTTRNTHR